MLHDLVINASINAKDHTCVAMDDSSMVCFGRNVQDQCDAPADLGPVKAVAAGRQHTCVVQDAGRRVCLGHKEFSECDAPVDLGAVKAVAASDWYIALCKMMDVVEFVWEER